MPPWLTKLLETASYEVVIPGLILATMFAGFALVILWAQFGANRFDTRNFFLDPVTHLESSERAFGFICLMIHTWWVATLVLQKRDTENHFLWYGVIWAGTPVMMALVKRWTGGLPFAQAGSSPSQDTTVVLPGGGTIINPPSPPPPPAPAPGSVAG